MLGHTYLHYISASNWFWMWNRRFKEVEKHWQFFGETAIKNLWIFLLVVRTFPILIEILRNTLVSLFVRTIQNMLCLYDSSTTQGKAFWNAEFGNISMISIIMKVKNSSKNNSWHHMGSKYQMRLTGSFFGAFFRILLAIE